MIKVEEFKQTLLTAMLENFKKDGVLAPVFFALKADEPHVETIPGEFFESYDNKQQLADGIKKACKNKEVRCAGIIIEAFATVQKPDSEMTKLLIEGNMRVADMKEKSDIIMMIYATPEHEETIGYIVDCKKKTIIDKLPHFGKQESLGGVFSNFFELRK